jgi:hypothetical protein
MDYRFVDWLLHGCPVGVLRFRPGADMTPEAFVAVLRHDALFQLLSRTRAHPVNRACIFRGYISEDEPESFRVAASLDDAGKESDWHATFKHHVAVVLRTEDVRSAGARGDHTAAANLLWRKGALLFILSAPRGRAGKWRIRLATDSPITGDCVLVVLTWVGNGYFGHEALRRGNIGTAPFHQLTGAAPAGGNVLYGLLTEESIEQYTWQSGVPLDDEQRGVLAEMNNSSAALLCVSALAGAGKTVLAHCVIKAFLEGNRGSDPRRLILYTVPTRSLREEVVLELVKFKASSFSIVMVVLFVLGGFVAVTLLWSVHAIVLLCSCA